MCDTLRTKLISNSCVILYFTNELYGRLQSNGGRIVNKMLVQGSRYKVTEKWWEGWENMCFMEDLAARIQKHGGGTGK
jgi:hypothetical protein